jgi:hypothetical protein
MLSFRLQDQVKETIVALREAGMKVSHVQLYLELTVVHGFYGVACFSDVVFVIFIPTVSC